MVQPMTFDWLPYLHNLNIPSYLFMSYSTIHKAASLTVPGLFHDFAWYNSWNCHKPWMEPPAGTGLWGHSNWENAWPVALWIVLLNDWQYITSQNFLAGVPHDPLISICMPHVASTEGCFFSSQGRVWVHHLSLSSGPSLEWQSAVVATAGMAISIGHHCW